MIDLKPINKGLRKVMKEYGKQEKDCNFPWCEDMEHEKKGLHDSKDKIYPEQEKETINDLLDTEVVDLGFRMKPTESSWEERFDKKFGIGYISHPITTKNGTTIEIKGTTTDIKQFISTELAKERENIIEEFETEDFMETIRNPMFAPVRIKIDDILDKLKNKQVF